MLQEEFNTKAAVLMKGTMTLRVTFLFIFPQNITRIVYLYIIYSSYHEKRTLSVKHFKAGLVNNMVQNSASRCHTLTNEQALSALDSVDFIHAKTCAKCGHRVIPASLIGLDQLTPQRSDPNLGYDEQVILPYCLECQRLCMERSAGQEARLHALIRLGYANHQPTHIGPRSKDGVETLKVAFKNAGSPPPSLAIKSEIDKLWYSMRSQCQDLRLKK